MDFDQFVAWIASTAQGLGLNTQLGLDPSVTHRPQVTFWPFPGDHYGEVCVRFDPTAYTLFANHGYFSAYYPTALLPDGTGQTTDPNNLSNPDIYVLADILTGGGQTTTDITDPMTGQVVGQGTISQTSTVNATAPQPMSAVDAAANSIYTSIDQASAAVGINWNALSAYVQTLSTYAKVAVVGAAAYFAYSFVKKVKG